MTWLAQHGDEDKPAGDRLAELWRAPAIVQIPGAHNALAALLARRAGFRALYLSGAALSASLGLADLGIFGLDELCSVTRAIARAAGLPLLVDADTGFGGVLNVMRTVRELEDAGAAAVQLEDQVLPKKCGHLNDKRLVPPEEMAAKVTAARRARRHLRIIARTDAAGVEGFDGALRRAQLYLEAGADAIFPEALTSAEMFRKFAEVISAPLLANMTEFGKSKLLTAKQLSDLGFNIVIYPVTTLRLAMKAIEDGLATIKSDGTQESVVKKMQTRAELYELLRYEDYAQFDKDVFNFKL